MNSELYVAASGLLVEERRLELIANNLANLSTTGYRAQRAFSAVYREATAARPTAHRAVALAGTYETARRGPLLATGGSLDVALEPGALLAVVTPGGMRYTRSGALALADGGTLVDGGGRTLADTAGKPLSGLPPETTIEASGRLLAGAEERGRLRVVRDPQGVLVPLGDGLFSARGNDAALEEVTAPRLDVGALEGSNVDPMGELVLLIETQRAFESYRRIVSMSMNEVNRSAVNQIAE